MNAIHCSRIYCYSSIRIIEATTNSRSILFTAIDSLIKPLPQVSSEFISENIKYASYAYFRARLVIYSIWLL